MRIIELNKSVTASNDLDAEMLRGDLKERGICLINLMSSPGSGKTTLISRLIRDMNEEVPIAVCEADIDSAVDAERIEALGAVAVQVHTDGMCHMDAGMTRRGLEGMNLDGIRLAFLENVQYDDTVRARGRRQAPQVSAYVREKRCARHYKDGCTPLLFF